jgi:hypothetical protein
MTAPTSLLDFILNLLKDPQAQADFHASPEQVLAANGLIGVSAADIHDTLPLVTDNRSVELASGGHAVPPPVMPAAADSGTYAAIKYLHHITCTYRYDDHGAHVHDPGDVNIWADRDVTQAFDHSHVLTGGPIPGSGGAAGTGSWLADGHGHSGYDQGDGLHSFGAGGASAEGTGSLAAYSGDAVGSHDSAGFRLPDFGGGAASPWGPDHYQTHDAHSSLGGSYYGQDSYDGHDGEHGIYDHQEPHIYLDLH